MSRNLAKIEDRPNLVKDVDSGAILLSNSIVADEYKLKKSMLNKNRKLDEELVEIKTKLADVDSIKADMKEIKELLGRILTK
jgi:cell shape-determining protein MreC